jgi:L-alanine-DL-glutamate epimerase-like enolase superfamily enzyme
MMINLRVERVEVFRADLAFKEAFRISFMEVTSARSVFVRVTADDGTHGMGEANPTGGITGETQATTLAGAGDLAQVVLGKSPMDIEGRMREINQHLVHNSTLRCAFDMALYDLAAKVADLPLFAFLGGEKRSFWTDHTIGIADPEAMAEKALGLKKRGFRAIKVKLGTTKTQDVERIRKIREAVGGDIPLRIDANQGWSLPVAVATLKALEPFGIEYCEQPVARWDYQSLREVRDRSSVPIMADESLFDHHDAFKLARMGACDLFNIKLAKSGGIHTALRINAVGESAGISCMLGCMGETRLGLSAAAHLTSARPNFKYADLDGHYLLAEDPIIGGAQWDVGEITLPDAPGHGADVDPGFLDGCECRVLE